MFYRISKLVRWVTDTFWGKTGSSVEKTSAIENDTQKESEYWYRSQARREKQDFPKMAKDFAERRNDFEKHKEYYKGLSRRWSFLFKKQKHKKLKKIKSVSIEYSPIAERWGLLAEKKVTKKKVTKKKASKRRNK